MSSKIHQNKNDEIDADDHQSSQPQMITNGIDTTKKIAIPNQPCRINGYTIDDIVDEESKQKG
jgi:hypothetical protein